MAFWVPLVCLAAAAAAPPLWTQPAAASPYGYNYGIEVELAEGCTVEFVPEAGACDECGGKVTELTLEYLGDVVDAHVEVIQKKDHIVVFDAAVQPGETFSFVGQDRGTLSTEITINVNGVENTKIHTSCSKPIGPGLVSGDFAVVAGSSRNGGALCPLEQHDEGCGECGGKVTELTLEYLGDVVDAHVEVVQKKDHIVVFDAAVQPGETFSFVGQDRGTLSTEITINVNGVENTKIHTSCSKPIGPGLVSGDFAVVAGSSRNGGALCPVDGSGGTCSVGAEAGLEIKKHEVKWEITNTGTETVTIARITLLWPEGNGGLTEIKLGKKKIYDQPLPPATATIDSGWKGGDKDREIKKGKKADLTLKFDNEPVPGRFETDPPLIRILEDGQALADGALLNRPVVPVIEVGDASPVTVTSTLNGAAFSSGDTVAADGSYTLSVEAVDVVGNSAAQTVHFTIDMTPPEITIVTPADGALLPAALVTITGTAADAHLAGVVVGGTAVTVIDGQWSVVLTLAEGPGTLTAVATDQLGQQTSVSIAVDVDTLAPVVAITYPPPDFVAGSSTITVIGTVDEAHLASLTVNGVAATVDGDAFTAAGIALVPGSNLITATAVDAFDRIGEASVTVMLDTAAPVVSIDQPAPADGACLAAGQLYTVGGGYFDVNPDSVELQVVAADGTAGSYAGVLAADGRSWTVAGVDLGNTDGMATATAVAADTLGNTAQASRSWRLDGSAPVIAITLDGGPFPTSEPVIFNRPIAPRATVTDGALGAPPTAVLTLDGAPYDAGTPIAAEGSHQLAATATDCAGHQASSQVAFTIDLNAPVLQSTVPADGALLPELAEYRGTADGPLAGVTLNGQPATVTDANFRLSPYPWVEGLNTVEIVLFDGAGNRTLVERTFTVDSVGPTIEIFENGTAISDGVLYTRTVTPELVTTDPETTITATLNGSPFAGGTPITASGDYTLEATATDALDRTASAAVTFTIDVEAGPTMAITAPEDGVTLPEATVTVTGTVSGNGVTVSVNGTPATVTGGSWSVALELEADVVNHIIAVARDQAGRTAQETIAVMVHTGGPMVVILEPADGTATNRALIDVAGAVVGSTADGTAEVAGRTVVLDPYGAFRALDVPLNEGVNTLTARATDPHGRVGEVTVTVTSDPRPPAIALLADGQPLEEGASFSRAITLRVEVSDAVGEVPPPVVRLNGQEQEVAGSSVELAVAEAGGYLVAVAAGDAAGNQSRIERSFIIDLGGCALTDLEPASGSAVATNAVTIRGRSGTAAAVSVRVPVPGTVPIEYQEYAAQLADGTFVAGGVPLANGLNALEIVCTDPGGDTHSEPLAIERLPSGTGPLVTINVPAAGAVLGGDAVTVSGTVSDAAAAVTVNRIAAALGPAPDGAVFSVTVPLAEGPNVLVARAVDAVGRSGSDRVVIERDALAPQLKFTAPDHHSRLGPLAGGLAEVDVTGLFDVDTEPHLVGILVATSQGSVQATVDRETGAFAAPSVALDPGVPAGEVQTITATATDSLGHSFTSTVDVFFDPDGPGILLTAPDDLTLYTELSPPTIEITGRAWAHEGAQISINGAALDPTALTWEPPGPDGRRATTFSAAIALPADDGAFGIVARVSELDGRRAVARRLLSKDTIAPEVVEIIPADGAAGVDGNALLLVLFGEPVRHATLSVADGLTLERLGTGTAVVGQVAVAGTAVAFTPGSELVAGESYRFRVGAEVTDRAGHPLVAPAEVTFTVGESTTAAAPEVDPPPAVLCAAELTVTGTAAPGAALRVRDGELVFSGIAGVDGAFAIPVPLSVNGYHLLHVYAVDRDGTPGAETVVQVRKDCSGPNVAHVAFDRDAATIAITFSEAIDPATVTIGDASSAIRLFDAEDPNAVDQTGSLDFSAGGTVIAVLLDPAAGAWWRDQPVRLLIGPPLAELQGNQIAAPYATVLFPGGAGEPAGSFLFGEAYDDGSGRPLEGARVRLYASGAALPGTGAEGLAAAEATTDGRGRFTMAGEVAAGRYAVVYEAPGYTRVIRRLALEPATGAVPFDTRPTPLAPPAGTLDPIAGGTFANAEEPLLGVGIDPAAVPGLEALAVVLTPCSDQALPDLLPLGWTPAAAAELRLESAAGVLPEGGATPFAAGGVRLSLPLPAWVEAADDLYAVRYELATGVWISLGVAERLAGPGGEDLARVPLAGPGTVAVVLADQDPATRPPLPAAGSALAGAELPDVFPALEAELEVFPEVIAPTGMAVATVVARSLDRVTAWPSGLAVQAYLEEKLVLAANAGQLLEAPFRADLILYHPHLSAAEVGSSVPGSVGAMAFQVSPSARAAKVMLETGYENIRLYPFPEQIERGQLLLGPAGGAVSSADGVELYLPAGALGEKTVVETELLSPEELAALPSVAGFATLAAVRIELSGHTLARPATVKIPTPAGTPAAIPGDPRIVFAELVEAPADGRGTYPRLVARTVRIAAAGGLPERIAAVPESAESGLPLPGIVAEGLYLVLRATNPIGFATGYVRAANGNPIAGSRVVAVGLGTADVSAADGRYAGVAPAGANVVVEALHPARDETGTAAIPGLGAGEVVEIDVVVQPVPPAIVSVTPADGATEQPVGTTVSILFSEPLDPSSVHPSTLTLEMADWRGEPTGVFLAGTVSLSAGGTTVTFASALPLMPGRSYLARFAGGVRDAGGVWYAGGAVSWTFSTSTVVVPGGEIHPERFYIGIPVDGVADVYGAAPEGDKPGALPIGPGWTVSPWVEGPAADTTRESFDAPGDGSFIGTVGHPPEFPVTLESIVWITVIDPNGELAGEFRLGPFSNEDGTAFVAPAGQAVEFTTGDGIVVQVPEGAFDRATVVTVTKLDAAALGIDEYPLGMGLGAYLDIDFEGEARESLRFRVPAPAGVRPDAKVFIFEPVDLPWGHKLSLISVGGVLEEGGDLFLSNDLRFLPEPPADKGFPQGSGVPWKEEAGTCQENRDQGLPRCFLTTQLVEMRRRQTAAFFYEHTVSLTLLSGGRAPVLGAWGRTLEAFYNALADLVVYVPVPNDWNGHYVLPVPIGQPLEIVQRDAATGWITAEEAQDPIPDGAGPIVPVGQLAEDQAPPPMLQDARPFDLIRFGTPAEGTKLLLRPEIEVEGKSRGMVEVREVPEFKFQPGASVAIWDLSCTYQEDPDLPDQSPRRGPVAVVEKGVSWKLKPRFGQSDHLLLVVAPGDLDPYTFEAFEFQFDQPLVIDDFNAVARLWDKGTDGNDSRPVAVDAELDDTESRLIVRPRGRLTAGHRFVLKLEPLQIRNENDDNYWLSAPRAFRFATRGVTGNAIAHGPEGYGDAVGSMKFGNLLMVATMHGGLVAFDLTDHGPSEQSATFKRHARMPGTVRALATDGHNRLFFAQLMAGRVWNVYAVRLEDVRNATGEDPNRIFGPVAGGVKIGYSTSYGSGLSTSEYLSGGAMPYGTPTAMEVMTHDEISETRELKDFYKEHTGQDFDPETVPHDDEGIYTFPITLESSHEREGTRTYDEGQTCANEEPWDRYQRVTVDNLTTGQSWSLDISNKWGDGGGGGKATLTLKARREDRLRVRYNLYAFGYVAYMNSGITVVNLNRSYHLPSPSRSDGQCGRRLGKYEGQHISWRDCARRGGRYPEGLQWTTDVAAHVGTGCKIGLLGLSDERTCRIDLYSPLKYTGAIQSTSPLREPGDLEALLPGCIQSVRIPGEGERRVFLHDVALANGAKWLDYEIRGELGPEDAIGHTFPQEEAPDDLEPREVEGDLLFVSLGAAGIFAFDVSDRKMDADHLIGHLHVTGHSIFRLQVDETRRLLFAGGFDQVLGPIIDVWDIGNVNGAPGTYNEARPIATVKNVLWRGQQIGVDAATGLIYTWRPGIGARAVPFTTPKFTFAGLYLEGDEEDTSSPYNGQPPDGAPPTKAVTKITSGFVPLGVPMESTLSLAGDNRWQHERGATAAFKVRLALPGSFGDELTAKVQSLRMLPEERFLARRDIGQATAMPGGPGWPERDVVVTLQRIGVDDGDIQTGDVDAGDVHGEGGKFAGVYNLYESRETVVLVADPRARRAYERQGPDSDPAASDPCEKAQCRRCDWPSYLPHTKPTDAEPDPDNIKELLAGGPYVRVFLWADPDVPAEQNPTAAALEFFTAQDQAGNYLAPTGHARLAAWADAVPSPAQISLAEPVLNPAIWNPGEAGVSVSLAAGDLLHATTDFAVRGRAQTVSLDRSYRSGVLGYGPLGRAGWNLGLFAHLREIPTTGEVEFHDGRGNVRRFLPPQESDDPFAVTKKCPPGYEGDWYDQFCTPQGLPLRLSGSNATGWRLMGLENAAAIFDRHGRLVELRDRLRRHEADAEKQGNTIRFTYDGFGQLVLLTDDFGRTYTLTYDEDPDSPTYGLLSKVVDFTAKERTVEYQFEDDRRLKKVILPAVFNQGDYSQFSYADPTIEYFYTDKTFDPQASAHGDDFSELRLEAYRLPGSTAERVTVAYHDTGRVAELRFPLTVQPWKLDWTPNDALLPVETVSVMPPWPQGQGSNYHLADGRIDLVTECGVPTSGDTGEPVAIDLETRYSYFSNGRLREILRADQSTVTFYYPDTRYLPQSPLPARWYGSGLYLPEQVPEWQKNRLLRGRVLNIVHKDAAGESNDAKSLAPASNLIFHYNDDNVVDKLADVMSGWTLDLPIAELFEEESEEEPKEYGYIEDGVVIKAEYDRFGRMTKRRTEGSDEDHPGESLVFRYQDAPTDQPAAGFLHTVTDGAGVEVRYGYDEAGNVTRRETSYCTAEHVLYDEWDRPIRWVSGDIHKNNCQGGYSAVGATVERAYDEAGHLIYERYDQSQPGAEQRKWVETRYTYNEREQIDEIVLTKLAPEELGGPLVTGTIDYEYDDHGRLEWVKSPGGVVTRYGYDSAGRVKSERFESVPGVRERGYDELHRLVTTSDGDQGVWRGRYDSQDRLIEETLPTGVFIVRKYEREDSDDGPGTLMTETVYESASKETRLQERLSLINSFGAVRRDVEVIISGFGGDPEYLTSRYKFDPSGRLAEVRRSYRLETRIAYDQGGRVKTVTDGDGNVRENHYELAPWPESVIYKELLPTADTLETTTKFGYDALGRAWHTSIPDDMTIIRELDKPGNVLSATMGGRKMRYRYDGHGLLLSLSSAEEDANSALSVRFAYDKDGSMRKKAVARHGHDQPEEVTELTYDVAGRLETRTRPGSASEEFDYYDDGALKTWKTRLTNKHGVPLILEHIYDAGNRLLQRNITNRQAFTGENLPPGLATVDYGDAYSYDALSRPLSIGCKTGPAASDVDPASRVTFESYDSRGLPRRERVGQWPETTSLRRHYDLFGNQNHLLLPKNAAVGVHQGYVITHDVLDRVTTAYPRKLDGTGDANTFLGFGAEYQWTGTMRLVSTESIFADELGSREGIRHTLEYNNFGTRLSTLDIAAAGQQIGELGYFWDHSRGTKTARSAPKTVIRLDDPEFPEADVAANLGWTWSHDGARRLTGAYTGMSTPNRERSLFSWNYLYGRADELLRIVDSESGIDRFTEHGSGGRPGQRIGERGEITFTHDPTGRRIEDDRYRYTYSWRGHLVQVDVKQGAPDHQGEKVTYAYDASGRLMRRTHFGAIPDGGTDEGRPFLEGREFIWDGDSLAAEVGLNYAGDRIWRKHYLPGPRGLDDAPQVRLEVGSLPGAIVYDFVRDEMGTVIALIDGSAPGGGPPQLLARYLVTPYGEAHIEYGPELLRIEFDPETNPGNLPEEHIGGALRIVTTLPLSPATFESEPGSEPGLVFEQLGPEGWEPIASSLTLLPDADEGSHLLAAPWFGWIPGTRYRITLKPTLADNFGRPIQLPEENGEPRELEVILDIPEDGETPPQYQRKFPLRFDSAAAAAHTFENTFRGGQTSLFQGLWTDPVTGIAYARARWYDARHASWLSEDPLLDLDSPNLYAFVGWQPHMATDPSGEGVVTSALIAGLISLLAGAAINEIFGLDYDENDAMVDFMIGAASFGTGSIISKVPRLAKVAKIALTVGTDIGITFAGEKYRAFIHGDDVSDLQLLRGAIVGAGVGYTLQCGGSRLFKRAGGDIPAAPRAGNGRKYLGPFYEEAKELFRRDPDFFPDPDNTFFRIVQSEELDAAQRAFKDAGLKGHHVHPLSHGGPAIPEGAGLVFTGETSDFRKVLSGLDLGFYEQYGKGMKRIKAFQAKPGGIFQFGLNQRHTDATTFWNKVRDWQRQQGLRY